MKEKNTRENYTRVTKVLYPFSGLDMINPEILAHAADRGTKVHKICEGIIIGLGEFGVEEETRPYVESFKKWWEKGHEVLMVEERFWDNELEITGQVDMIIRTPDGLAIVDFKTSSKPSKTWAAQGAAYAYLAKKAKHDIKKIYFLHLLKTGKEAKIYEYPIDDSFFFAILRVWEHFYKTIKI
ncbi:MAG: PD-(D/E)XK nuclease family protein [Candidatus Rhabdochlamydia sp.]